MHKKIPDEFKSKKELDKIRSRVWYQRYKSLAELLKKGNCENPVEVLKQVDKTINDARGYGYDHVACSAWESLQQVVEDMGWEWSE